MAASTVLNGARTSLPTTPATRQRNLDAEARLPYRQNATALALVNRRRNTIGVAAVVAAILAEICLRLSEDISVAGLDDRLAARTTIPQLTAFRQPLKAMDHRAVEVLLDLIGRQQGDGKRASPCPVIFPGEFAMRTGGAAPPAVRRIVPVIR